jgi:hypothetical protein
VRLLLLIAGVTLASVLLGATGFGAYFARCHTPSEDAMRILVPWVGFQARSQFEKYGRITDAEGLKRLPPGSISELYRVSIQQEGATEDVLVEPRRLCFCRKTYVLYDRARRLRIVGE